MIITYDELEVLRDFYANNKIVLATGTFDLFHYEHLKYLQGAKEQGDILVVGIKDDQCASFKGKNRPIICEEQRIAIVDGLKCVDYSILVHHLDWYEGAIPYDNEQQRVWLNMFGEVFNLLKPDILYYEKNPVLQTARDRLFEYYNVNGVSKPRTEIISTTKLINKIMALN